MDINKMTERTQQAFTGGQELANERGNRADGASFIKGLNGAG